VLSMAVYSTCHAIIKHESDVDFKISTPLAIGSVIGGVMGKLDFVWLEHTFKSNGTIGAIQSACLFLLAVSTLIYTFKKGSIVTKQYKNFVICLIAGLFLGMISTFLGIGGGPINLIVLQWMFSMQTKKAAQNSIYIILFSQAASLIQTLISGTIPMVNLFLLAGMIICGISGGIIGRLLSRRLNNERVDKLFAFLTVVIMLISIYNTYRYLNG